MIGVLVSVLSTSLPRRELEKVTEHCVIGVLVSEHCVIGVLVSVLSSSRRELEKVTAVLSDLSTNGL